MIKNSRVGHPSRVVFGFFLFLLLSLPGLSKADTSAGAEPVEYTVEDIHGSNVQVLESGETQWEAAVEGQDLESGDEIKVGGSSEATLMMGADTSVHLDENSDLKVDQVAPNETGGFFSKLEVLAGRMLADVKKNLQDSHSTFEVDSNGVVCGVRGTAFEVEAVGGDSQVATHEGKVEVAGGGETHMVTAGNFSAFRGGRFQSLRRLNRMEIQRFQRWRAVRQGIRQRRFQRLMAIRNHTRQPWIRKHPRLGADRPLLKRDLEKKREKRKLLRKKLREQEAH